MFTRLLWLVSLSVSRDNEINSMSCFHALPNQVNCFVASFQNTEIIVYYNVGSCSGRIGNTYSVCFQKQSKQSASDRKLL